MIDVFVARQPIFDRAEQVQGYELLYRSDPSVNAAVGVSANRMVTDTVVHAFLEIGIDTITQGQPAFINCTRDVLLGGLIELLDPKAVVIELLETVACDAETIAACERLVAKGYRIALDDFVFDESFAPFLRLASIVKVDVLNRPAAELMEVATQLKPYDARLLAERVENAEVHDDCVRMGFELFQGYHYQRPEILTKRTLSVEQLNMLRLMNVLRDPHTPDARVEDAFRSDPTLTYKLLGIVNSASMGGRGVQSIGFAIRLVGREALYRWLSLMLVSSITTTSGAAGEMVETALVRARMCELVAEAARAGADAGPYFFVGLFSRLDVILGMPMDQLLARVDVAPEVRAALMGRTGPYAATLDLVEAYEKADWTHVASLLGSHRLQRRDVVLAYTEAMRWTHERLRGLK